jgi:hypothetical protein
LYTSYSTFGRGIPDLSAQALNFKVIVNGIDKYSSGTGTTTAVRLSFLTYI